MQTKDYEVSWEQFEVCNANPQDAFEKMCRWLFNEFFFDGKELLHSNPNNSGIEVIPKMHMDSNKRISFQAKFFSKMDYNQIMHSVKMAVKHYSGQLDIIYLYCNKDVTITSEGYQSIVRYLKDNGINIEPITNQAILEQVMKNENIARYFFNHISLTQSWFQEKLRISLASLGPRYNDEFNVSTHTEEMFSYYLCNAETVNLINRCKNSVIEDFQNSRWKYRKYGNLVNKIIDAITAVEDITQDTIEKCLYWSSQVKDLCNTELTHLNDSIIEKKKEYAQALSGSDGKLISELSDEIEELIYLYELPDSIMPKQAFCSLIQKQVIVVKGEAGVGKTQLFAIAAEKNICNGQASVLLLGTNYLNNVAITVQTPEILGLNISLETFLYKLEGVGVQQNRYSYIFIDAINESTYKNIWNVGLWDLISQIKNYPHIKLAISVRSGYEKIVFNDAVLKALSDGTIGCLEHNGFREESVEATRTFLDHYGIPFLPSYFLQAEMTNPLFLTLFCRNYSGENFDMFTLFERLMEKANNEAMDAIGILEPVNILYYLVDEIVDVCLDNGSQVITQKELFELNFWNLYGLSSQKISYVTALVRAGFLISMASEYTESYMFGYNLLQDFVCAKKIIKDYSQKENLIQYIHDELLKIENGNITKYYNIDIFIVICGLYADRFHEECFDDIKQSVTGEWDRIDIVRRYLSSFLWRKASSVNSKNFIKFINTYPVERDLVFRVLIENSTKEHHPLNAKLLHKILLNKELVKRDALWTTYINNLANADDRLFQLITYFDEGELLNGLTEINTELLLILLSWLYTSTNRFLRDKASKAAIELLKSNFKLCKPLLKHFEDVNDPYVLQRLYGVVFGACIKCTELDKREFRKLVKYVFNKVFNQDEVYPDILLRDYAKLIIERWVFEYPDDCDFIDLDKVKPPYNSKEIPTVEKQEYYDNENNRSGYNKIYLSMKINHPECPGLYGDFGRYTFQAALETFDDVDIVNLYHYAMQFIRDELGYDDEILEEYDRKSFNYMYHRHITRKIERIGKKYQWIALYNILARVSDRYLIKKWGDAPVLYEGAWEPYVRDFDPTLNKNTWKKIEVSRINYPIFEDEFLETSKNLSNSSIERWKYIKPNFFNSIPNKLMLEDEKGVHWISLYLYDEVKNKKFDSDATSLGFSKGSQQIWLIARAFFMKQEKFDMVCSRMEEFKSKESFSPEGKSIYQLFNREYAWTSGYNSVYEDSWIDYEVETGGYRLEKDVIEMPDFENLRYGDDGEVIIPMIEKEFERRIPKEIIHLEAMPAYSRVLWEEEYDASQDEATSFNVPCGDIIKYLELEQKTIDGFYYSKDGILVSFDASITGNFNGLLIRKDFLDKYIEENNLKLCWKCIGEKQYFLGDINQKWSNWNGIYYYDNGQILGKFDFEKIKE